MLFTVGWTLPYQSQLKIIPQRVSMGQSDWHHLLPGDSRLCPAGKKLTSTSVWLTMSQVCLRLLSHSSLCPKPGPQEDSPVHKDHVTFHSSRSCGDCSKLYHHHQKNGSRQCMNRSGWERRGWEENSNRSIITNKVPYTQCSPGNDSKPHQLPTLPIKIKTTKKEAAWQGV